MEAKKSQGKKRPIGWLIDKAMPVIHEPLSNRVLDYIHEYNFTPNDIYTVYEKNDSKEIAKAARWLAIIYRDYGSVVFQQVIDLVRTINAPQPEDIRHEKD